MTPEELIEVVRVFVRDAAIEDTNTLITNPPGRGYPRMVADRTAWVNTLDTEAQGHLQSVIRQAVHAAIYGFLCVLDGTRIVRDGAERGDFELFYASPLGRTLVNDPREGPLHDIYNADLQL